eukprot:m.70731 g.70731  ORF g.70731 m.70731 type:complete len:59 (-) comp8663_c0_seq3:1031-1207(-)
MGGKGVGVGGIQVSNLKCHKPQTLVAQERSWVCACVCMCVCVRVCVCVCMVRESLFGK